MSAQISRVMQRVCFFNFVFLTLASASLIQDDFDGISLDTKIWGKANTGGAAAPMLVDGRLIAQVATNSQNQRSLIYSTRTDLDFTSKNLTLSVNLSSLGGKGGVEQPVNCFLLIVCPGTQPEVVSRYYPGSELPLGVWLSAGQTNGVNYLEVGTVRLGRVETVRKVYQGVLSSMSLTLLGESYSVSASGKDGFSVGENNRFSGTLPNIHAEEYRGPCRFAMGVANSYQGAVSEGASALWDSVVVTKESAP